MSTTTSRVNRQWLVPSIPSPAAPRVRGRRRARRRAAPLSTGPVLVSAGGCALLAAAVLAVLTG